MVDGRRPAPAAAPPPAARSQSALPPLKPPPPRPTVVEPTGTKPKPALSTEQQASAALGAADVKRKNRARDVALRREIHKFLLEHLDLATIDTAKLEEASMRPKVLGALRRIVQNLDGVGNHPNAWFSSSVSYHNAKSGKAGGGVTTTTGGGTNAVKAEGAGV